MFLSSHSARALSLMLSQCTELCLCCHNVLYVENMEFFFCRCRFVIRGYFSFFHNVLGEEIILGICDVTVCGGYGIFVYLHYNALRKQKCCVCDVKKTTDWMELCI